MSESDRYINAGEVGALLAEIVYFSGDLILWGLRLLI